MVEDDTDELYGDEELDHDEHMLAQLMLQMRKNLETFLRQQLQHGKQRVAASDNSLKRKPNCATLVTLIEKFRETESHRPSSKKFASAMDKIRVYGNMAAHATENINSQAKLLDKAACEHAVANYRSWKEKYLAELIRSK